MDRFLIFIFGATAVMSVRLLSTQVLYLLGAKFAVPAFEGRDHQYLSWFMAAYYLGGFLVSYFIALNALRRFCRTSKEVD